MIGQDAIKALRRSGRRPEWVYINDFACQVGRQDASDTYTVSINPREPIETLDLRFVVGLQVNIAGSTVERTKALIDACRNAGAVHIAACAAPGPDDPWGKRSFAEIWHG